MGNTMGGMDPMINATYNGDLSTVKRLCQENPANSEVIHAYTGNTPLHFAAAWGLLHVVKYLCEEAKVNKEATNKDGKTALGCAIQPNPLCQRSRTPVVEYLKAFSPQRLNGSTVEFQWMNARNDLNGKKGTVIVYIEDRQRYNVKIDATGEVVAVKPGNIKTIKSVAYQIAPEQALDEDVRLVAAQFESWKVPKDEADEAVRKLKADGVKSVEDLIMLAEDDADFGKTLRVDYGMNKVSSKKVVQMIQVRKPSLCLVHPARKLTPQ